MVHLFHYKLTDWGSQGLINTTNTNETTAELDNNIKEPINNVSVRKSSLCNGISSEISRAAIYRAGELGV